MSKLRQIISNLKSLTVEQQEKDLLRIIRNHERELIILNRQQLLQGIDARGHVFPEYSKRYAEFKGRNIPDLKLTGEFQNSFFLSVSEFPVIFLADDDKTFSLIQRYGENIFGLTKQNKEVAREDILKDPILEYYRKRILGL